MHSLRVNVTTELQLVPREAFDAVVYFDRLTPATVNSLRFGPDQP